MCDCDKKNVQQSNDAVPDFSTLGFSAPQLQNTQLNNQIGSDVLALNLSGCVKVIIQGHQFCFELPILGRYCVDIPGGIPLPSGEIKACFQTCGRFIPTGAKITFYAQDVQLFTYTIGSC